MTFVRFSTGGGTMFLSLVGLLICLAGMAATWTVKDRIEIVGRAAFSAADESLLFVDAKLARIQEALDNSRRRVTNIANLAERLRDARADAKRDSGPLLQSLEEIFRQLQAAESWLESCHAVAQGIGRVSEAVVSSEYAASHQEAAGIALAQRVEELSKNVAEVLAKLQVLRQELTALRDSGKLARDVAARVVARVADVDERLAAVSARIDKLGAKIAKTKAACDDLRRRVHGWIIAAAAAIIAVLAWFGLSQIAMLRYGWRMLRAE